MGQDILCIGSVLWDVIGRASGEMRLGSDVGGRITRLPGGVALNIAMTCARFGLRPVLLSAVGRDVQGDQLLELCAGMGLETGFVHRAADMPTDQYMAIEGANGVIAAIADAHTLEAAGDAILAPLQDGRLGTADRPFQGLAALDGNLTEALLVEIADGPLLAQADLRIAPASPGKAKRLAAFLKARRGVLYVNCEEAGILCGQAFDRAADAAKALVARGAARAIVTDGGDVACDADQSAALSAKPPETNVARLTGAGDTFMAAHIAAEAEGATRSDALDQALQAAAAYVSGDGS